MFNRYPYTNFHELNLDYFIQHFNEIFTEWEQLYNELQSWKTDTTEELDQWRADVEKDLDDREAALRTELEIWKQDTADDISEWETATLNALDAWKTAATAQFEAIRVQAAASAEAAAASQTAAASAAAAALLSETAAKEAAAAIQSSAAQIQQNADAVDELKTQLKSAGVLQEAPYWENGRIASDGTNSSQTVDLKSIRSGFIKIDNTKTIRVLAPFLPSGNNGIAVVVAEYLTPKITTTAFITSQNIKTWEEGITKLFTLNANTQYIRICIRPVINGAYANAVAITPDWHSNVYVLYNDGSVVWAWKNGIDKTLTEHEHIADAKTVGDILFGNRGAEIDDSEPLLYYRYATGDTWADVPLGSFAFHSGSTFDTLYPDCPIKAGSSSVFTEVYGGRKKTSGGTIVSKRARIIRAAILSQPYILVYGYVTEAAETIAWRIFNYADKPSISIAYFGDSITRGVVDNSTTPTTMASIPIPGSVANEMSCRCENFGIGSIGWCNNGGDSANKGIAYDYLKRWVSNDSEWYGTQANQFIGSGSLNDFDTIILAYGANDNIHYNLGLLVGPDPQHPSPLEIYDDMTDEEFDPDTVTDLTILVQMYRCVRYLKKKKPTLNIIIVAPFVAGSFRPTGDYTRTYMDHTKNSLIAAYKDFAEKYGCGFISTYDAPINRFNLSGVLNNSVHPNDATYIALGKYMAGKISALAM